MQGQYRVHLLGPVELRRNGQILKGFRSQKHVALLGYLITNGEAASRSFLAELFWSDKSETRGRANLSGALHEITSLLPDSLRTDRQTVQFKMHDALWVDTIAFDRLVQDATPASYREALALYRGEFLMGITVDDCDEAEIWLAMERERWRQRVSDLLQTLTTYYSERGMYKESLEFARRLEQLEPWREETHRHIMHLLARSGQRSAALVQYETCRRVLQQELGVEPAAETTLLYERIRTESYETQTVSVTTPPDLPAFAFVDRTSEHAWLVERWNQTRWGRGKVALIEGEAGSGKTRLVTEVLRYLAGSQGITVLSGHCYSFRTPTPYHPIAEALRQHVADLRNEPAASAFWSSLGNVWIEELTHLLPELRELGFELSKLQSTREDTGRQRLFEAIAQYLHTLSRQSKGVVLFVDDLHYVDEATIDLLNYLVRRLNGLPVWFLGAYRPEIVGQDHALVAFRRAQAHENKVAVLQLSPLSDDAIIEVVRALPNCTGEVALQLADFLADKSEGNARVLMHYIEYLEGKGILKTIPPEPTQAASFLENLPVPFTIREAFLSRTAHLSAPARDLLDLAAVIGERFSFKLMERITDSTKIARTSVVEWIQFQLVTLESADRCAFRHGLLREVIYKSIPLWRRQELHRNVAVALEALRTEGAQVPIENVAYHYAQSGMEWA